MYIDNQAVGIEYSANIGDYIIEKIIQLENKVQNFFKSKNAPEFDLFECFDNFSDLLFSIESFEMEFIAFSNFRIIIEYILDNNFIDEHKKFVKNNIDLFFNLLDSKIDLIKRNDSVSKKEYEEQLKFYDSKILEYNSYFYKHVYENIGEDNQDAIAIGKILLN